MIALPAAFAILRRVPSVVWFVLAGVIALWAFGTVRYRAGVHDERERQEVAQAKAAAAFQRERQAFEREQATNIAKVRDQLHREAADAIAERDSVISGLRDGSMRLRERFRCPSVAGRVSATAGTAPGGNGAGQGGLSDADAEFLVRLASEADQAAKRLAACQATIRSYRQ